MIFCVFEKAFLMLTIDKSSAGCLFYCIQDKIHYNTANLTHNFLEFNYCGFNDTISKSASSNSLI